MCVVSMIMNHTYDKWPKPWEYPGKKVPIPDIPSEKEVEEFRKLLERARKYDEENNQPDCELDEKRKALKTLADELGIEIDFL